ncbi:WD40 repeat domain-containing protein [Streptosporangiaceae bacterium NEAU-GS5]|nr:WD40 repeat domain-containing protein [Streptosporangiaceae bacterium NEAU-GS5]
MEEDNLHILRDPETPAALGNAVAEAAESARDVLWVHYVGHGLVSPSNELHLATVATDRRSNRLAHTALPYAAIRDCVLNTPARSIVVVLDCCFSGRAVGVLGKADGHENSGQEADVDLARVHGGYVLAAAARDEAALAPPGAVHTAFTGELIRLFTEGDAEGPQQLTLRDIYRYLYRTLYAKGFPRPRQHASGHIDDLVLCPNPAYQPPSVLTRPTPPGPASAAGGEVSPVCPYPGLTAFGPGQAQWFFGRERLIAELAEALSRRIDATDPLVVVGPTGAGKSSLLGAGLLPALAKGAVSLPGSGTWPRVFLTPTEHPLTELTTRLAALSGKDRMPSPSHLADKPSLLAAAIRAMLHDRAGGGAIKSARLVVVVDQLEEIFAECVDVEERRAFIRTLRAIADGDGDDEPPALVVLGLRADFYGHCAAYPELRRALQNGPVVVGPMNASEVRDAITRPAEVTGQALQPGLVEVLLRDLGVGDEAEQSHSEGALPLLAHALLATWQHREDHTLTVSGYQAAGSIKGAVAATAEAAYGQLDSAGQQAVRLLMLRMIQVGEDSTDTRRRVNRSHLINDLPSPQIAAAALEVLVRARLVTLDTDTAEITHEALLRAWPRLHHWIDADRVGLRIHQRLAEAADAWDHAARDSAHLYQGSRLALAREWATDPVHQTDLTGLEREFLDVSNRAAQRRSRRQRQVIAILTVLLLLVSIASGVAIRQTLIAQAQERLAVAGQLSAESATLATGGQPEASMLHAVEAFRRDPSLLGARSALLSSQSQYFAARLTGHADNVNWVAFSPDGRTLATASADDTVKLWDVARHTAIATLAGHNSSVNAVAFSPDGRTLATASADDTVKLWSVASHKMIATLNGHTAGVIGVAFSPDGKILASVGWDRTARLWSVVSHRAVAVLTGHTDIIQGVAFSPDGHTLATASIDKTVRLWDVAHHKPFFTLTGHTDDVNSVAFSPDGRTLATAGNDRTARLWSVARHKMIATLTGHVGAVWAVAFNPDGKLLATTSVDGTARLWDVTSHQAITILAGHTGAVWGAAFSPDGNLLVTTSNDDSAVLWSLNGSILTPRPTAPVKKVAFSPDGRILATTGNDRTTRLWDVASHTVIAALRGNNDIVYGLAFSPDGRTLATTSNDGTTRLWDVARHHLTATLPQPGTDGTAFLGLGVVFSPDGRTLVTTSNDGTARLWSVAQRKVIATLDDQSGTVWGAAFSVDGRTLATVSSDKRVRLWDVSSHKMIAVMSGHTGAVYQAAFGPDGRTLATVSDDKTVRLWDVPSHKVITAMSGHSEAVWAVAFSPDRRTLATVGGDKTVRLWDVPSHKMIATLTGHTAPVYGLAFSPDGHTLATTSNDGTIRLWDTDPARVIAHTCHLIGPISRPRWTQLIPEVPYYPTCQDK